MMRYKASIMALLLMGLLFGFTGSAFAALTLAETAAPAVFAPGQKDAVISSFNFVTAGADPATTLDVIYMNGLGAGATTVAGSIT
ncbi:MAG: hypothetical protein WCU00_11975, partial [Candidatus Latescibacterota bacterium]